MKLKENDLNRIIRLLDSLSTVKKIEEAAAHASRYYNEAKESKYKNKFKVGDKVYFISYLKGHLGRKIGIIKEKRLVRNKVNVILGKPKGEWHVPYTMLNKATKDDLIKLSIEKMTKDGKS